MPILSRNDISQITCGIRFEKSFRIGDISGQIFDTVLHNSSSPFGTDFFPRFQELNTQDRALVNSERGYYLRITTSDIVFQYTIQENKKSLDSQIEWFKKDAIKFIIDKIIHENGIKNIIRFGFMVTHVINGENLGGNVINQLSGGEIKSADQFTLRFGNKDITGDGLIKKGVDDYVNKITTIRQTGETEYDITLDYQYYFIPQMTNLKDWDEDKFFERAQISLDNRFYSMINPLISKMVEVA